MLQRYKYYFELMRFHKPIGTYLLLWPTLWGVWAAADGWPATKTLIIFILGSILMRAGGCVINDIADIKIDGDVKRTAQRPLVSGKVTLREAWMLFAACSFFSFSLVLLLNKMTILLSFIGLALTMVYPFTKRWIDAPQLILGAAFAWAIPMAYAATQQSLPWSCWYLYGLVVILAVAYDTLYAMVDKEDDLKIGVKSSAILFGRWDKMIVLALQLLVWSGLLVFGLWQHYSNYYEAWVFIAVGFFIYQQILIADRIPEKCFKAFLNHHWFVMWVWIGFVVA
ncbi:MAG: 4-hydroxybenzoate octaprenyltransferase [Gammaproteobacteria bacterium]|nr:4-hydroxybenzoate octaprenyltransferase [Gammaproteobacteria bacterium]